MGMKPRVLLLDSHNDVRSSLVERLNREPSIDVVGAAASVAEAERILAERPADVVLVDIHEQGGDGVNACRRLKELSDATVVAFTSFLTAELWRAAQDAGAVDYLLKHIDTGQLSRQIARLVERHRDQRSPAP